MNSEADINDQSENNISWDSATLLIHLWVFTLMKLCSFRTSNARYINSQLQAAHLSNDVQLIGLFTDQQNRIFRRHTGPARTLRTSRTTVKMRSCYTVLKATAIIAYGARFPTARTKCITKRCCTCPVATVLVQFSFYTKANSA